MARCLLTINILRTIQMVRRVKSRPILSHHAPLCFGAPASAIKIMHEAVMLVKGGVACRYAL